YSPKFDQSSEALANRVQSGFGKGIDHAAAFFNGSGENTKHLAPHTCSNIACSGFSGSRGVSGFGAIPI
ncbi:hypothetical protein, partial [Planktomarina sp.]|uniref:hypothetical protein n=1 Tax=Planktomarina sp. TaxID=2024851 RepID=UPI003C721ED5